MGTTKPPKVFMQVIVRDSLDEDKRVARFPKTAALAQTTTTTTTSSPSTKSNFMQLVVDQEQPKRNLFRDFLVENDPEQPFNRDSRRVANHPVKATFSPTSTLLTPPDANARFASYNSKPASLQDELKITSVHEHNWELTSDPTPRRKKKLPHTHPFRRILPKRARIVGVKSKNKPVFRKPKHHGVMTVEEFLERYPDSNQVQGAIPVPLLEPKHVRMVEFLATSRPPRKSSNKRQIHDHKKLDDMIDQLEKLIAFHQHQEAIPLADSLLVKPRGSGPSFRFAKTTESPKKLTRGFRKTPKLEFGFRPIIGKTPEVELLLNLTTTPAPTTTTTTASTTAATPTTRLPTLLHPDPFQTNFDDYNALRFPRLISKPAKSKPDFLRPNPRPDAFFFTTTSPPDTDNSIDTEDDTAGLTALFDMRKFFFIPTKLDDNRRANSPKRRFFSGLLL